ncbi:MAG TPA: hypothetical protein VFT58_06580, partial [Nitrososphaera sp.]|nr:hypothetical protein [Nitrososphaera sp.]
MRIERDKLARVIQQVSKAVNARNTIPILGTVRMVTENGILTVTGSSLDVEISARVQCDGDITACVDAKLLSGIVAKLPAGEVDIESDGTTATV